MQPLHAQHSAIGTSPAKLKFWNPWLAVFTVAWLLGYVMLMPKPIEILYEGWPFIVVGFLGAIIGNITALGGGLIFIPVLIFGYHIPPVLALKTSIVTQAFGMTSGALAWRKSTAIPWYIIPWALPGLLVGCTISSLIVHPNTLLVKGLFGPVSILLGIMLLITAALTNDTQREQWQLKTKICVIIASLLGGLITGWVAIGEGEIVAAVLMLTFGFSAHRAISLGVCLLAISSIYLATLHTFVLGGIPWQIAAFTMLGSVFGARLAPICTRYFEPRKLKYIFAIIAILDGLLFIVQFWRS